MSLKPYYFNLSDENETIEKAKQIINENEKIDTLINNAGILENALFQMSSVKKMKEVFFCLLLSLYPIPELWD